MWNQFQSERKKVDFFIFGSMISILPHCAPIKRECGALLRIILVSPHIYGKHAPQTVPKTIKKKFYIAMVEETIE